ncbi:MAG: hypothetical protein J1G38_01545 [Clostridiales bacterium]|nr:hypothetical protein [Clostridiales bacterium]
MKKIKRLFLIVAFAAMGALCMTACASTPNGDKKPTSVTDSIYEISVDASKVSVDASDISVYIYSSDGMTELAKKKLSQGKAQFELDDGSYVATLGGLPQEVSYSSVLLTKNGRKAKVTLETSKYDRFSEEYSFAFTIIMFPGDRDVGELDVQVCDDSVCRFALFTDGNVADVSLNVGDYVVKVGIYTDDGLEELYHENCTVTLDRRFCVVAL